MKRLKMCLRASIILPLLLLMGTPSANAHDQTIDAEFSGVGHLVLQEFTHTDADPWKGFLTFNVKNTGTQAWGDFHFEIFGINGADVSSVIWDVITNLPTSSQDSFTFSVNGPELDLFFYADPVLEGDIASFSVYTDNTAQKFALFGVSAFPTPVPVPGAAWLLGSGLLGLLGLRKRS